ncbi:Protein of unknown function [Pyronema omphalodes CBS 100304]|uniref:Uncharacterized protein n=1 Tax=Pyronema omphalodes (strain CBS 100304) TaxID=1076935 RepID=U4L3I4_PYROM|nr:Protein of unknown function [Pyronema omphalodes CBS 100304]
MTPGESSRVVNSPYQNPFVIARSES